MTSVTDLFAKYTHQQSSRAAEAEAAEKAKLNNSAPSRKGGAGTASEGESGGASPPASVDILFKLDLLRRLEDGGGGGAAERAAAGNSRVFQSIRLERLHGFEKPTFRRQPLEGAAGSVRGGASGPGDGAHGGSDKQGGPISAPVTETAEHTAHRSGAAKLDDSVQSSSPQDVASESPKTSSSGAPRGTASSGASSSAHPLVRRAITEIIIPLGPERLTDAEVRATLKHEYAVRYCEALGVTPIPSNLQIVNRFMPLEKARIRQVVHPGLAKGERRNYVAVTPQYHNPAETATSVQALKALKKNEHDQRQFKLSDAATQNYIPAFLDEEASRAALPAPARGGAQPQAEGAKAVVVSPNAVATETTTRGGATALLPQGMSQFVYPFNLPSRFEAGERVGVAHHATRSAHPPQPQRGGDAGMASSIQRPIVSTSSTLASVPGSSRKDSRHKSVSDIPAAMPRALEGGMQPQDARDQQARRLRMQDVLSAKIKEASDSASPTAAVATTTATVMEPEVIAELHRLLAAAKGPEELTEERLAALDKVARGDVASRGGRGSGTDNFSAADAGRSHNHSRAGDNEGGDNGLPLRNSNVRGAAAPPRQWADAAIHRELSSLRGPPSSEGDLRKRIEEFVASFPFASFFDDDAASRSAGGGGGGGSVGSLGGGTMPSTQRLMTQLLLSDCFVRLAFRWCGFVHYAYVEPFVADGRAMKSPTEKEDLFVRLYDNVLEVLHPSFCPVPGMRIPARTLRHAAVPLMILCLRVIVTTELRQSLPTFCACPEGRRLLATIDGLIGAVVDPSGLQHRLPAVECTPQAMRTLHGRRQPHRLPAAANSAIVQFILGKGLSAATSLVASAQEASLQLADATLTTNQNRGYALNAAVGLLELEQLLTPVARSRLLKCIIDRRLLPAAAASHRSNNASGINIDPCDA